jgi:hypothetical protein
MTANGPGHPAARGIRPEVLADPMAALLALGARVSPALTRPGPLVITARDCVACGPDRDCQCRPCEAPYLRWGAEAAEPCGMTIGPVGRCPRGHAADDGPARPRGGLAGPVGGGEADDAPEVAP